MIDRQTFSGFVSVLLASCLSACGSEVGGDYCKHHFEVHPDHIDTIASLAVSITGDGNLSGDLSVPVSALNGMATDDIERLFASSSKVFALQADTDCAIEVRTSDAVEDFIDVRFDGDCGAGNKLGRIDITLFDHLAHLDELEASVTTPATAKHFAISRQCDAPIFRLEKPVL